METGAKHPHEDHLLEFVRRFSPSSHYVWRTAEMIKAKFPASAGRMLPLLRKMYQEQRRDEAKRRGY